MQAIAIDGERLTWGPAADPELVEKWEAMQVRAIEKSGQSMNLRRLNKGEIHAGHGEKVA